MKGILFTESMFNAVINGTKTQTRRIMKPQPKDIEQGWFDGINLDDCPYCGNNGIWYLNSFGVESAQPRYKVGEKVYLKEEFCFDGIIKNLIYYKYDNLDWRDLPTYPRWKNKIFMPEKYARYFIEITGVRCERLQDISDEDCLKEGVYPHRVFVPKINDYALLYHFSPELERKEMRGYCNARQAYAALIDKINGKGTWESNPYVWVYDFKLVNNNKNE